jgi:hypothetical protein
MHSVKVRQDQRSTRSEERVARSPGSGLAPTTADSEEPAAQYVTRDRGRLA